VPAAAVIPAPVAYINVVAVKKLVVGFLAVLLDPRPSRVVSIYVRRLSYHFCRDSVLAGWFFYFEKIRVFKAGLRN